MVGLHLLLKLLYILRVPLLEYLPQKPLDIISSLLLLTVLDIQEALQRPRGELHANL